MSDSHLDDILCLLSDVYRRQIIQVLRDTPDSEVAFEELVDDVLREPKADAELRERVVIQLHHTHLPKLSEAG